MGLSLSFSSFGQGNEESLKEDTDKWKNSSIGHHMQPAKEAGVRMARAADTQFAPQEALKSEGERKGQREKEEDEERFHLRCCTRHASKTELHWTLDWKWAFKWKEVAEEVNMCVQVSDGCSLLMTVCTGNGSESSHRSEKLKMSKDCKIRCTALSFTKTERLDTGRQ